MDFLKKNYEKVLLGLVLLGLAAAVACLPFLISNEKQKLDEASKVVTNPKVTELTNVDLSGPERLLKSLTTPAMIDFGPPNRLFNPMPWQKSDHLIPVTKVGPTALLVSNIQPLYLTLTLDEVKASETGAKYIIGIEKPAPTGTQKVKTQDYCTLSPPTKNKTFMMLEVKGKPEDPTQVVVQMNDTSEKAVLTKNPGDPGKLTFRRIEGYMADLRYDPEKRQWTHCRVNSRPLPAFNGEEYNIVAVTQNEVVLSAKSNGKKWTIKAAP
jgi:hypothetical protein